MSCSVFNDSRARQLFAAISGGLSLLIAGAWVGWTSPFLAQLKRGELPFNLTTSEQSWIVSFMDLGTIISPIPSGYLMDVYGRKTTLLMSAVIFQISWILVILAKGPKMFYAARLLAGFAKGISFTICPIYLAEISVTEIRGTISGLFTVLLFAGTLSEFVAGLFVHISTADLVSSLVPVLFLISLTLIPESPYYLLMKNDKIRASKSYEWLHPERSLVAEQRMQTELDNMEAYVKKETESKGRWINLIKRKGTRQATCIIMTLHVMQRLGGINTMISYMSTTLPANNGIVGPEQAMILFAALLLVTSLTCMPVADWLGRRPTLIVSGICCAILQAVTALYYFLDYLPGYDISNLLWIPYGSMLVFAVFYQIGLGMIPHTLLGEIFPSNVKSKAAAGSTICAAFSTFLLNKAFPIISETYGKQFMFMLFSASHVFVAIFTYLYVIETKGKTFAEIQADLNRSNDEEEPLL